MGIEILTARQKAFLELFGKNEGLPRAHYLTGGTPLAAFYLHHRYSEDLDFFSEQEIDVEATTVFVQEAKKLLRATSVDFQQSFNRNLFFLQFPEEVLKIEFTYFPFSRMENGMNAYGVSVDSLLDIAVNKLFTIYQRTKARDYIDLCAICQQEGYRIQDLLKKAKLKFDWHIDPLQLGTQFLKAKDAEDLPRMIVSIPEDTWKGFFVEEAKKLKTQIFEM